MNIESLSNNNEILLTNQTKSSNYNILKNMENVFSIFRFNFTKNYEHKSN